MASKQKAENASLAPSKSKFAESLLAISHRFSIFTVFDDFLTMSIAACTQNLHTKKSWYEDEYMATVQKYKGSDLRFEFPNAFASLSIEMEDRFDDSRGNDVLGEFFEQHISNGRNGQFFTPYPVCQFIASITATDWKQAENAPVDRPLRILDPACGSGRMLLATHRTLGPGDEYYGIDIDRTCVKMTALNLFFNGVWNSEVMCANALSPDDFVIAYRISSLPLGIFKIEEKENSRLWNLNINSFKREEKKKPSDTIILDSTPFSDRKKDNATQLGLF